MNLSHLPKSNRQPTLICPGNAVHHVVSGMMKLIRLLSTLSVMTCAFEFVR